MATKITEDMIKSEVGIQYGIRIVANLFSDCFLNFEDLFSVDSVKHHLFHCTFKNPTHPCQNPQCNHVHKLRVNDFKTIYQTKKYFSKKSDLSDWEPRKDIKINELDLDVFRRLSECKYIKDNKEYQIRESAVHNMIEFRDAAAHTRETTISRQEILEAICLIKKEEDRRLICKEVKRLFHEKVDTLRIDRHSSDDTDHQRDSFLKNMLLNVPASKEELHKFAYNNLGFCFEGNSLSTKNSDFMNYFQQHQYQEFQDNINKSWLLHTICYFGIDIVLELILNEPESQLLPLINNVDNKNQNILMNACEQNHWNIAENLLRKFNKNWNLYQRDSNGKTALLLCLNKKEMIELFIKLELNIIGLSGFDYEHIEQRSTNDNAELNMHSLQIEEKNQQISAQTWTALTWDCNITQSTLLKSQDNNEWEEKNYLKTDNYQPQLFLKCDIENFSVKLEPVSNSENYHGKQTCDEIITKKHVLTYEIGENKVSKGLCISKSFEPVLVVPCGGDYKQDYILTNIISIGDETEIFGDLKKRDKDFCVSFQPQSEFLTLECFYVRKRPKRRKYVLTPFQENIILLVCGGSISFPKGCIKQPHTVEIWEKKMEQTNKKYKIKAGTDMVFVHSKVHQTIEGSVKFEFDAPCKANLYPRLLKVHTESSEYNFEVPKTDIQVHGQTNKIIFEVTDLCGKCVVFCEEEQIPDEILVKEVKLLYLNYKRCTAWFCLEKIANGIATAQVLLFTHDEDLPNKQKMQFEAFQKKPDLIIRDFCTFHIQCAGSFACKDEQFLHVQFCSEENHITFEIEVKNNKQPGTFQVEGLPDITNFEVDFPVELLEQPIIIESGKRQKKKERLDMSSSTPKDKVKVEFAEGSGTKLGDCPRVELQLQKNKAGDLKPLHRLLFGRVGAVTVVKKNIRQFSGFTFDKSEKEYEKKIIMLNKCTLPMLKFMCEVLDLERKGTKEEIVDKILTFCMQPKSSGKALPKSKRKSSSSDKKRKRKKKKNNQNGSQKKKSKPDEKGDIVEDSGSSEDDEEGIRSDKSDVSSESEEEVPPKKKSKNETTNRKVIFRSV